MIKKVLVTGADGFIGSHLVENLLKKNLDVKALVYYNSFNSIGWLSDLPRDLLNSIEIVSGDIRDYERLSNAAIGCDAIVHLAALIGIPYSYEASRSYIDTNIIGTYNVLQTALKNNISRIIHTSTSEVYGSATYVPIDENHPLQGQSPYSASKIAADQLAYSFFSSFNLPVLTLRPFNTYGPRQSNRAVIPTVISQALRDKKIKIGNTTPTRDFNFVDDTVESFSAALLGEGGCGEVYNIGSNFEISITKTIELISKNLGVEIEYAIDTKRVRPEKSEVTRLYSSNKKFITKFKYEPKYSGLIGFEKGLKKTIDWFSNSNNISKYNNTDYVI